MVVYFSLGTNLGDKEQNLRMAVQKIRKQIGEVISLSAFYATAPWGFSSDNTFLNAALCVDTALAPLEVLQTTQEIEREMGRTHKSVGGVYSDRVIDIDLLLYGDRVLDTPELKLPHPLMHERRFVMEPLAEIAPETTIQIREIEKMGNRVSRDCPILIAEDSILLSRMIHEALNKAGYTNLKMFSNGQELWDYIKPLADDPKTLLQKAALVITDIEMPSMDGHRLTKLIKSDNVLKQVPVIIFSSLVTEEMRIKGKQLGADEQLSKPEIGHLVDVMDGLLERRGSNLN
jgi:2-amino-4-hydroxy-6-hydroxymethyldihydropteridine diphosphokinase